MRKAFTLLVLAAMVVAGWVGMSLYLPYQNFPSQGVFVDVPHGASRRTVARLLASQGVVRSRLVFEGLSRWRSRSTLQAGEYFFDHPITAVQAFDTIANGRVYVRELTIPEGFSMFDIADLVAREDFTTRESFLAAARNPALIRDLIPGAPSLEGFLFPATYEFPRHPTGEQMVSAMVTHFRDEWTKISAEQTNVSGLPLQQVVTLASLVERETPRPEERPVVAGVFLNRLHHRIPLQCDPTVVYALELAGSYGGALDAKSLPFNSPYNTYRHIGLPPGPIANPGSASLKAALNPPDTDYLYFVANTEGGHFFGKTLAEHNHNVALYRQRLAEQRSAIPGNGSTVPPRPHTVSAAPQGSR
ncbi:MAG TPA: endolytic transglycosylase MltG [Ktedonobacteraceae bacterium]|nr:endolytic transglycosylase MltG [Ktedonobacteraceae bacterium]